VGEDVWLLSADGVVQNETPYQIVAIAHGPDGQAYAQFLETETGWLLTRCERATSQRASDHLEEEEFTI
jgi:hypothetical protein